MTLSFSFRVSIERAIGMVTSTWQRWRHPKGLSRGRSDIAEQFLLSVHILNMRTCARRSNPIATFYKQTPPTLDTYMRLFSN